MVLFYLILNLLFSNIAVGKNCSNDWDQLQHHNQLASSTDLIVKKINDSPLCEKIQDVKTIDDLDAILDAQIKLQDQKKKSVKANELKNIFNKCEPTHSSTTLFLSFTGTGSFEPQSHDLMGRLLKCSQSHQLPPDIRKLVYYRIRLRLNKSLGRKERWSGVEAGPLMSLLEDKNLAKRATNFDFVSFPSEESSIILNPQAISLEKIRQIPQDIQNSRSGKPVGIQSALECTTAYFKKAKELGIKPKLVIVSHSSGGRSTVKFLESLKINSPQIKADLVFTIDPVKEAQHAIQEVLSQYTGNIGREILRMDPKPVNVWTRSQPKSLYKTSNTKKWINVYQNKDTHGFGMALKFGIHGSPIEGADQNLFITDGLNSKAHGEIVNHAKVLAIFKQHIMSL